MANKQVELLKEINKLRKSYRILESTGDDKRFLDLSRIYKSDRNRIHKEIVHKYSDLFAVIQNIRELSVLGVQSIDLLVSNNEIDITNYIKRYNSTKALMIKYIDVFDEIMCLIENGFPDGAMQRWRTFLEYSIIIIFILEQGEEVAEAYTTNSLKSLEDELRPRTNFAWANTATCLKGEKSISIKRLLEIIKGIPTETKERYRGMYKLTSQTIHGTSFGTNLAFNDYISVDINDIHMKNATYYTGGISTVITHSMVLLIQTFIIYFNAFPDGGLNIKGLWNDLCQEYVKVYMRVFEE